MKKTAIICCILLSTAAAPALAQNTGIGTNTPTDQLHTTGTVRFEGYRGAGTRLMQIDSSGRIAITGAGPVNTSLAAFPIPDNGCASGNGVTSTITVSGLPTAVLSSKIAVRLYITHPADAEVSAFLVAPNGNVIRLLENYGAGSHDFTATVLSDEALTSITGTSANGFAGTFKPKGIVSTTCLLGTTANTFAAIGGGTVIPNGAWTLKVYDNAAGNTGTLSKWDISFSGPASFATADESGYVPKFIAGNLVKSSIFSYGNGFIGINTPAPLYPLTLNAAGPGFVHQDAAHGVEIGTYTDATEGWLQTYTNHPLAFSTNNGNVKMELSTAGNVGIGITSAVARLHISSATTPVFQVENPSTLAAGVNNEIYFKTGAFYTGIIRTRGTGSNAAAITFSTNAATTIPSLVERLTILDNGNIGVGTTTPAAKLDVNGPVRFESGSPAAGSVLTATNSSGDAVWTAPALVSFRELVPNNIAVISGSTSSVGIYTEQYDEGADCDAIGGAFTAPRAGLYHFDVNFRIGNNTSTSTTVVLTLSCTGASVSPVVAGFIAASGGDAIQMSDNLMLAQGDVVRVALASYPAVQFNILSNPVASTTGRSTFSGYLVH